MGGTIMKKNILIILISGLLFISITINISAFVKLDKFYEKTNETIASDYLKIDEALVNVENTLKENEDITHEELIELYENILSSKKYNSVYSYAMDTNIFKWINEDYRYTTLDQLAQYLLLLQIDLDDASPQKVQEIKTSLIDLCEEWEKLHIKRVIVNDTYNFQTDSKDLLKSLRKFNDYCYNCCNH